MHISIVQIRDSRLRSLNFATTEPEVPTATGTESDPTATLDIAVEATTVEQTDELCSLAVDLAINIGAKSSSGATMTVEILVSGTPEMHVQTPDKSRVQRRDLVLLNGLSLLYGMARELVLWTSVRSGRPAMVLPAMNFVGVKVKLDGETTVIG